MRFNIDALSALLATNKAPDWEGGLCYKAPLSSGLLALQPVFKERYFKLIGNLLFCLREKVNKYLKPTRWGSEWISKSVNLRLSVLKSMSILMEVLRAFTEHSLRVLQGL